MGEVAEFERRITAALARIGTGLERMALAPGRLAPKFGAESGAESGGEPVVSDAVAADPAARDEVTRLQAALAEEQATTADLREQLRVIADRDPPGTAEAEARIKAVTRQLDVQGLELRRMRKTTVLLREQLRSLRETQSAGLAEPHMINKAMLAELEALRATRASETAEMDEILAEMTPLLQEVRTDA